MHPRGEDKVNLYITINKNKKERIGNNKLFYVPKGKVMKNTSKEMIIKAMEQNPVLINNHTDEEEGFIGLVEFNNEYKGLGGCFNARYFCINEVYINEKDEKLHLSEMSIGGNLFGITSEDIDRYNESVIQEGGKIKCIHLPNGSKVYPSPQTLTEEEEIEMWEEEDKLGIPSLVQTVHNSKGLPIHELYSDGLNIYYEYDEYGRLLNVIRRK